MCDTYWPIFWRASVDRLVDNWLRLSHPLLFSTDIEYRAVIFYFTVEGKSTTNVEERLHAIYVAGSQSYVNVWWKNCFVGGIDDPRSGRPTTSTKKEEIGTTHNSEQ